MNNDIKYTFQLASDIHIEKLFPSLCSIVDFITPSCKNLILAGDIGSIYYKEQLTHFLRTCADNFETVIFVPGNNEYYTREEFEPETVDSNLCAVSSIFCWYSTKIKQLINKILTNILNFKLAALVLTTASR